MKTINFNKTARIAFIAAITLTFGSLFVQANTVVKGKILDRNNKPVMYATATAIDPQTMQIVQGDMCDNNGIFVIENLKPGKYLITFRSVGFETEETRVIEVTETTEVLNAGKIYMSEAVIVLNEIQVVPAQPASKETSQLN